VAQADRAASATRLISGRNKGREILDMAEASLAGKRAERMVEQQSHPGRMACMQFNLLWRVREFPGSSGIALKRQQLLGPPAVLGSLAGLPE
jgi:hypothetical protein